MVQVADDGHCTHRRPERDPELHPVERDAIRRGPEPPRPNILPDGSVARARHVDDGGVKEAS
jgi:hypothetical protein